MSARSDISVVICTRDRADMLRITLGCLADSDRTSMAVEAVVVDNGSRDATQQVAHSFDERLRMRYIFEPTAGRYGKSHALNAALQLS